MNQEKNLKDFIALEFPKNISAVYIIFLIKNGEELPFYVGETGRFLGRVNDYLSANFKAATDFKVGEAIKYFQELGCRVIIKYRSSENRKNEQDDLIRHFQNSGIRLLNELAGYNYKTADKDEERKKIKEFCDATSQR